MNDDFSQDSPRSPGQEPKPGDPGSIVPRHLPVWRPTDEYEYEDDASGGADEASAELASDPSLTTPQKIEISYESDYVPAPAYSEPEPELDEEARAAEYLHYGQSADTAYDDEVEEPPYSGLSETPREEVPAHEKELELMDHLRELRQRLLRSVVAIVLAMCVTWQYRNPLLNWFSAPIEKEIKRFGGFLITLNPAEGFMLYLQITFAAAVLLVIPIVLYQLWAFIEPALTKRERRYGIVIVPFSVTLFFTGSFLGYYLTPLFFRFFLEFQPPGTTPSWSYAAAASLLAKMLLVFGACFQVPVVAIVANKLGLVSRNSMIEYWRHVVVAIFIFVAVITPTWDPFTMCAAAIPPCFLYAFSIWLVKWLK